MACACGCCCRCVYSSSLAAEGVSTASWDNARRYPIPLSRIQIPRTVDLLANYTSGEEIKWIMSEDGTDFKNHPVFCWSGDNNLSVVMQHALTQAKLDAAA